MWTHRKARHCQADGCNVTLHVDTKGNLCSSHFQASRKKPLRFCTQCQGEVSHANTTGICAKCRCKDTHRCTQCNKRLSRDNRTGKCMGCLYYTGRIPKDRIDDYLLMRSRLGRAKKAYEWIVSGKPVTPVASYRPPTKTAKEVIAFVSSEMSVPIEGIIGRSHEHRFLPARVVIIEALVRCGMSFTQIGRRLNRHHTTILHYSKTIYPKLAANDAMIERIIRQAAA